MARANTRTVQYWIDDKGREGWDADHPMVQLLLVGFMPYSDIDMIFEHRPEALYLVTAKGGIDRLIEGRISDTRLKKCRLTPSRPASA